MSLFCYLDRGTMEAPGPEQHEGWSRTAVWSRDRAAASSVSRTSVSAYVAKGQKEAAERAGAALKQLQQRRRQQKRAAQVPQTPEVTAEEREDGWNEKHHRSQPFDAGLFDSNMRKSEIFRVTPRRRDYVHAYAPSPGVAASTSRSLAKESMAASMTPMTPRSATRHRHAAASSSSAAASAQRPTFSSDVAEKPAAFDVTAAERAEARRNLTRARMSAKWSERHVGRPCEDTAGDGRGRANNGSRSSFAEPLAPPSSIHRQRHGQPPTSTPAQSQSRPPPPAQAHMRDTRSSAVLRFVVSPERRVSFACGGCA